MDYPQCILIYPQCNALIFSILHEKVIASVVLGGGRGGSTIDVERINTQSSLSHEKAITSVGPGEGRGDG